MALSRTRTAAAAVPVGLVLALFLTRKTWLGRIASISAPAMMGLAFLVVPSLHTGCCAARAPSRSLLSGQTTSWQYVLDEEVSLQPPLGHGLGNKRVLLRRGEGE